MPHPRPDNTAVETSEEAPPLRREPAPDPAVPQPQPMARRRQPCEECPWRRDAEPGKFTPEKFAAMRETVEQPEGSFTGRFPPVFACHMTTPAPGRESIACTGALAVCGQGNLTLRIGLALGRVPAEAVEPGEGWPELFDSFEEMADANAPRPHEGLHVRDREAYSARCRRSGTVDFEGSRALPEQDERTCLHRPYISSWSAHIG
ncbi:hypothetical protein GCM10009853_032140 [Glycomyces scopariae]